MNLLGKTRKSLFEVLVAYEIISMKLFY
jgi:hypothetical protein